MAENQPVRKKKKRRKKNYLLRLIIIIALGVGLYYFATSELFDIHTITVENNVYYTSEQIVERSGVVIGGNMFSDVHGRDAKKELISDPYIKDAAIRLKLPDTVVITVEERTEAAAIPYSTNFILIDAEGLVLRVSEVEPKLPLLLGLTIKGMEPGKALEVEENSVLSDTLLMIKALTDSDVYFKKIDLSKVMVRAYVYDSLVCQGMPQDITGRVSDGTLQKILYELYGEGIERGTITVTSDPTNMAFSPAYE